MIAGWNKKSLKFNQNDFIERKEIEEIASPILSEMMTRSEFSRED